jgi:uncharacterized protein (DUF433 family)
MSSEIFGFLYNNPVSCSKIFAEVNMSVIHRDPETMSVAPVFRGTRVPLQNLFDALEHGRSLEEFLESFPTVGRKDAIAALRGGKSCSAGQAVKVLLDECIDVKLPIDPE